MPIPPGTKADKIISLYAGLLEKHFDALDSGYRLSRRREYGAKDFFHDWAFAMERMGQAWTKPWEYVFPKDPSYSVVFREHTAVPATAWIDIIDIGRATIPTTPIRFANATQPHSVTATPELFGTTDQVLLLRFDAASKLDLVAKTAGDPLVTTITDSGGKRHELELHII